MFRAAIAAFFFITGAAFAGEPITVTSQYGPGKPQTLLWERFSELVEAERPGAFDITIVTGGALGGEKEEAEAMRLGAIEGALSTVAALTTWVPLGAVLDLPFLFEDAAHIERALSGPLGQTLRKAYRDEGFVVPAFIIFGARHVIGSAPLKTPADMDGITMRVLQSDLHVALWRSLNVEPTALPITEAYGALANGVVSAMDMTKSGYEALKLYEVAPIMSETAHIWAIGVVYFDAAFWDTLSAEDADLFGHAAREAAAHFNELAAAEQAAALARTLEAGATLVRVDQTPWRDAVKGFAGGFTSDLGPAAKVALDAIDSAR
ncbi:MAG: TRAP transporter substrate-binding protein [Pseudomonadota bacterium]